MSFNKYARTMQRLVRKVCGPSDPSGDACVSGQEMKAQWYDQVYARHVSYHVPFYSSVYYPIWTVIADRLVRQQCAHVLDIGCGPGQFAACLHDWEVKDYTGIDFSTEAVTRARALLPQYSFYVADARSPEAYQHEYDAVVCTEVLEHIQEDHLVVSRFRSGARCLCTVPNFPYDSHVRHFETANEVHERYVSFFKGLSVTRIKGTRNPHEQFFLMDGVRNTHSAA